MKRWLRAFSIGSLISCLAALLVVFVGVFFTAAKNDDTLLLLGIAALSASTLGIGIITSAIVASLSIWQDTQPNLRRRCRAPQLLSSD